MNLEQLRALCAAATPGPWCSIDNFVHTIGGYDIADNVDHPDAAYIAAFNPETVKLLLAVAEAAQNEAIRYNEAYCNRAECEQMTDGWATLDAALAALEDAP